MAAPSSDDSPSSEAPPSAASEAERCANCATRLHGGYCHRCGQAADVGRLRFRRIVVGLLRGLVDLDSKTLRTVRHLFTKPGAMVRAYVSGQRVPYLDPLRYYMLAVAVSIGIAALIGVMDITQAGANQGDVFWKGSFVSFQVGVLYAMLMFPIAVSQWYLHRTLQWTIAAHYVFLIYLLAQSVLILIGVEGLVLLVMGTELHGTSEGLAWIGVFIAYILWAGRVFFAEPLWQVAWKTVGALLGGLVSTATATLLIIGMYNLAQMLLAV